MTFHEVINLRSVQALVFAKFMSDSAWFFLLFWLPKYLYDVRDFDVKQVSYYGWIPYAASGIGSAARRLVLEPTAARWRVARSFAQTGAGHQCLL